MKGKRFRTRLCLAASNSFYLGPDQDHDQDQDQDQDQYQYQDQEY